MKFSGLLALPSVAQAKTAAECQKMAVELNSDKQAYMKSHAELKKLQEEAELVGLEYDDAKETSTWTEAHKEKSDALQAKFTNLKNDVNSKSLALMERQSQLNAQITSFQTLCSAYISKD